jgi:hypothetical protein
MNIYETTDKLSEVLLLPLGAQKMIHHHFNEIIPQWLCGIKTFLPTISNDRSSSMTLLASPHILRHYVGLQEFVR